MILLHQSTVLPLMRLKRFKVSIINSKAMHSPSNAYGFEIYTEIVFGDTPWGCALLIGKNNSFELLLVYIKKIKKSYLHFIKIFSI